MQRHFKLHKIEILQRETILNHGKSKKHLFMCKKLGFETATYPPFDSMS